MLEGYSELGGRHLALLESSSRKDDRHILASRELLAPLTKSFNLRDIGTEKHEPVGIEPEKPISCKKRRENKKSSHQKGGFIEAEAENPEKYLRTSKA